MGNLIPSKHNRRIVLFQRKPYNYMGLMYISCVLKKAGFCVDSYIEDMEIFPKKKIQRLQPKIAGFYLTSLDLAWFFKVARYIKTYTKAKIIVGGPHVTINQELINHKYVDAICLGEGEQAMLKYSEFILKGLGTPKIPNLWLKYKGQLIQNGYGCMTDLSSLGYPDVELYSNYPHFRDHQTYIVLAGRGCPYNCSFCINQAYIKKFGGTNIRKREVEDVIKELLRAKPHSSLISFLDETLNFDTHWLENFLKQYSSKINIPFICWLRADKLDAQQVHLLKSSGCLGVYLGVESPYEEIRMRLLNKQITDASLFMGVGLLRKEKIKVISYNIAGFKHDPFKEVNDILSFNRRLGVNFAITNIIRYLPGTKICENVPRRKIGRDFTLISKSSKLLQSILPWTFVMYKAPWIQKLIKPLSRLPKILKYPFWFWGYYTSATSVRPQHFFDRLRLVTRWVSIKFIGTIKTVLRQ